MNNYIPLKSIALLAVFSLAGCTMQEQHTNNTKTQSIEGIDKFQAYTQRYTSEKHLTQNHATGHVGNLFLPTGKMGGRQRRT